MRHAIISGGSSGIGLALAMQLAAEGWDLAILARRQDQLKLAQEEIRRAAGRPDLSLLALSADVCDEKSVNNAVDTAIAALGPPALVIASAGIVIPGRFSDLPPAAFADTMMANYFGTLHLVRAALPSMQARRSGNIVLISSGAGLIGIYGYSAYAPTKFAVRGLAEVLRGELKPDGIGVHVVYPPDTDTPQLHAEIRVRPEATSRIAGQARICSPQEVAAAILQGVRRGDFSIAPGWQMGALACLHSLVGPLLHRFSFDPIIARLHARGDRS